MVCQRCQRSFADGAAYCPYCGSSAAPEPPRVQEPPPFTMPRQVAPPMAQPPYGAYTPPQPMDGSVPEHPVVGPIKRLACSRLYLVAAIALSVVLVLNIVSLFLPATTVDLGDALYGSEQEVTPPWLEGDFFFYEEYDEYGDGSGDRFDDYENGFNLPMDTTTVQIAGSIPTLLFSGLTLAAVWLVYFAGRDRRFTGMKTTGLTILQVLQTILAVLVGLLLVLLLFSLGITAIAMSAMMESGEIPAEAAFMYYVYIALLVIIPPILGFLLFTEIKLVLFLSKVRKTIVSGLPVGKGSLFVGVIGYIMGALCALGALTTFLPSDMVTVSLPGQIVSALISVAQAVMYFAFGKLALDYRAFVLTRQYVLYQPPVPYAVAQNYYGVPAAPFYGAPVAPVIPTVPVTPPVPSAPMPPPAPVAPPVEEQPAETPEE